MSLILEGFYRTRRDIVKIRLLRWYIGILTAVEGFPSHPGPSWISRLSDEPRYNPVENGIVIVT